MKTTVKQVQRRNPLEQTRRPESSLLSIQLGMGSGVGF